MTNHNTELLAPVARRFEEAAQMLEGLRSDLDTLKGHGDNQREHSQALASAAEELARVNATLDSVLKAVAAGARSLESATAESVRFLSLTDLSTTKEAVADVAEKTQSIQDAVAVQLAAARRQADAASGETQQLRDALSTLRGAISTMPERALKKYGLTEHAQGN